MVLGHGRSVDGGAMIPDERQPIGGNREVLDWLFERGLINLERGSLFDSAPSAAGVAPNFARVEGMLLGLAIGDSLGNTSEGLLPHERVMRHGEVRDYLPNRYAGGEKVGLPSDDTQLAFWTLERLIRDGRLVPERLATDFATNQVFGMGGTVREFVRNHQDRGLPWYRSGPDSAGNGALMRIAPVVVPHLQNPSPALWADAAVCAMITHNSPASTASCLALVSLIWEALHAKRPFAVGEWIDRFCSVMDPLEGEAVYAPRHPDLEPYEGPVGRYASRMVVQALEDDLTVEEACRRWHSGAYLLETVPTVLYVLARHGDDPEEAIVRAVNDTKDNDTVAAIVGAVVGALHGSKALPRRWVSGLAGRTGADDDGRVFRLIGEAKAKWG